MTERNQSRPWTDEEDTLLKEGIALYGEHDHWKSIALSIPGRTNKACRKRWLHSLSPTVKKCAWTPDEDELLLELHNELGPKWSTIARSIPGRTDDACSKRYREALDPRLKKDEWTPMEDNKLIEAYNRLGGKWGKLGQELGRSGLGCRNRWRLLERKRVTKTNQENSPHQTIRLASTTEAEVLSLENQEVSELSVQPQVMLALEDSETQWPPYYPPEMYPPNPDTYDRQPEHHFRELTPAEVISVSPHVAPFQFSSSSLSTALSDPPPRPRPLPPESVVYSHSVHLQAPYYSQSEPQSQSTSPLTFNGPLNSANDVNMSQDDCIDTNMDLQHDTEPLFPSFAFDSHFASNFSPRDSIIYEPDLFISISPISPSALELPMDPLQFDDAWKSPHFSAMFSSPLQDNSPANTYNSMPSINENFDDFSSASSTPFGICLSISPTSSPNSISQVDLPMSVSELALSTPPVAGGSLLFSVSSQLAPNSQPPAPRRRRKIVKKMNPQALIRLSSNLRLSTDPNVRPYACGLESCWPADEESSQSCFATSRELIDHSKDDHLNESLGDKPFRCGLEGCGKSWKSINGLQYHLQISAAHFKNALQSRFSAQKTASTDELQNTAGTTIDETTEDPNRIYACPRPQCFKAYRQPSGLRYHLKHGHPSDMPMQLPEVPPVLEREMPKNTKKMRRKASPDPVSS